MSGQGAPRPDPGLARRLERWRSTPATSGLFVDFDGTLAPIVDDPAEARALPGAVEVLAALAERLGVVAVVSGRPVSYLAERLPGAGRVVLAGLYGLERVVDGEVREAEEATRWRPAVEEAVGRARRQAPQGVLVEAKGPVVALHVRSAPEHQPWIEAFAAEEAARSGLVAHAGRMSVELRPPSGADKGSVVAELGAGLEAVGFFGDDLGDLSALVALRRLAAAGAETLGVAVASDESPAELLAAADVVVDGPRAVLDSLRWLLGR